MKLTSALSIPFLAQTLHHFHSQFICGKRIRKRWATAFPWLEHITKVRKQPLITKVRQNNPLISGFSIFPVLKPETGSTLQPLDFWVLTHFARFHTWNQSIPVRFPVSLFFPIFRFFGSTRVGSNQKENL